jgi:DNA-binding transcriptional LysR family regulator
MRDMPNAREPTVLKQLRYLVSLAREQHFGRAAASCNISQPTLSAALRTLEEAFGVPIVVRSQRFMGFTPEGERVLAWARRILADTAALEEELSAFQSGLAGRLRLGVIPSALPVVPLLASPFCRARPRTALTVLSQSSIEIQRTLDAFEIEAGLTYLDNEPLSHVSAVPVYRERYVAVAAKGGLLSGRPVMGWAEAAELPLCLLPPTMQNRRILDAAFQAAGRSPAPQLETNSLLTIMSQVGLGDWCTVLPQACVLVPGFAERVDLVPLIGPEIIHDVGIVVGTQGRPGPVLRAFLDSLADAQIEQRITALCGG